MKFSFVLIVSLLFATFAAISGKEWRSISSLITAVSDNTAITIGDSIYLVGGCSTDQICPDDLSFCVCPEVTNATQAYTPTSDAWTPLPDAPHSRFRHAAVNVGSKMYILGGRDVNDVLITQVDIFDVVAGTWSISPVEWFGATSDLTAVAIESVIYAIGGYDANYNTMGTVWTFDTLSTSPSWESDVASPMQIPRGDSCTVAYENKIYVLGGYSINFCDPLSYLEVYDVTTNTWQLKSSMDVDRGDFGCAMAHGKLHVIGGEHKDHVFNCSKFGFPIDHVEIYDVDTNTWYEETSIPDTRFRFAAASFEENIYVFGGQGNIDSQTLTYNILDSAEEWVDDNEVSSGMKMEVLGFMIVSFLVMNI